MYKPIYHGAPTYEELSSFLKSHGFRFEAQIAPCEWFANELWVKTSN
jgi:hypothetical protein